MALRVVLSLQFLEHLVVKNLNATNYSQATLSLDSNCLSFTKKCYDSV